MCKICQVNSGPEMWWANPHGEPFIVAAYGMQYELAVTDDNENPPS